MVLQNSQDNVILGVGGGRGDGGAAPSVSDGTWCCVYSGWTGAAYFDFVLCVLS